MKQRKWLSRMAATAAAMATLLTGGVVAGTALAADTDPAACAVDPVEAIRHRRRDRRLRTKE